MNGRPGETGASRKEREGAVIASSRETGLDRHFAGACTTAPRNAPPKKEPLHMRGALRRIRQRPTLPPRCQGSTIGAEELNFRVRDGNGCCLLAKATGNRMTTNKQMNRVPAIVSISNPRSMVKPHGQLVSVSSTHYCAYTSDLSTS